MLFRLAYLGVTNTLALLRLLPVSDRDKNAEILTLRHQIAILQRQPHGEKWASCPPPAAVAPVGPAVQRRRDRDVRRVTATTEGVSLDAVPQVLRRLVPA